MDIKLQPGKYIVAVSGGVDSVVLLDLLVKKPELELVVAHFDHGIRSDSAEDMNFVKDLAKKYSVPFISESGNLGADASEATARDARYIFLHKICQEQHAKAIVTAHHEDDVIETAFLNLLRGTNRKGLSSLQSTDVVARPLLHISKQQLIDYATNNKLPWREDSTNQDETYRRNYVRHNIVSQLTPTQRKSILININKMSELNQEIDTILLEDLRLESQKNVLKRRSFIQLPHKLSIEVFAAWLRLNGIRNFDTQGLQRMVVAGKTYSPGQKIDVNRTYVIGVNKESLALKRRDR